MADPTPAGQKPYGDSPGPDNEYVGTSREQYPAANLPGEPNDRLGVDAMNSIEEASNVGTTDTDTEAQSLAVNYGRTGDGKGSFLDGVNAVDFRAANVPVGAGGEGSDV